MPVAGGMDRLIRTVDNLYTAVFERADSGQQNRPRYNVIVSQETVTLTVDQDADYFIAPKFTWHGNLVRTGSDGDQGDGTYRVASGTRLQYGSGVLDETTGAVAIRFRPQFASTADPEAKYLFAWTRVA